MSYSLKYVSFDSMRAHGQMNTNKNFYPSFLGASDRKNIMNNNKQHLAEDVGFESYKKIFIPIQKSTRNADKYKDGYCYTLTSEDVEKYEDLYDYDVYADIVKVTSETPGIAIAYPAADCAVIKAVNMKTNEAVLAHCGGEYMDRYLPMQTIDALGGDEKDIKVYVSPFAHSLFYSDANNLTWATNRNSVWFNCLEEKEENGMTSVRVNVYKALKNQLMERCISEENIVFSQFDTSKDNEFYSNSRQYQDKKFLGRFLSGIVLTEDKGQEQKPYVKVIR